MNIAEIETELQNSPQQAAFSWPVALGYRSGAHVSRPDRPDP